MADIAKAVMNVYSRRSYGNAYDDCCFLGSSVDNVSVEPAAHIFNQKWRQQLPPKSWPLFTKLHDVISQKTVIFMILKLRIT